jgi:hypothetical protein
MATYNGSKWKGSTLSIQIAKENFLDRYASHQVYNVLANNSLILKRDISHSISGTEICVTILS